ncbi:MAG: gamma carbonic anhydrase family protein [Candidatus Altiarchaeota archaeon]
MKNSKISKGAYIHSTAVIYGDVTIGENSSIWPNAVLRGDKNSILIGKETNIQDNVVIHTTERSKVIVGNKVSIGHGAILHGCIIKDNCIIGMGAIVMDNSVIEENCIIAAGAVVTSGKKIPKGSLAVGIPAKVVRELSKEEILDIEKNALSYVKLAKKYKDEYNRS